MEFNTFLDVLDDNPFEELPVSVQEFVEGERFLNHPYLSPIQYDAVECMSQIYYREDLERFMAPRDADMFYDKYTKSEVILQLGKGCHDPNTPVYSPETGNWIPLKDHHGAVESKGSRQATPAFVEGEGQMYKVTFSNYMTEIVYGGHKYLAAKKTSRGVPSDIADYQFIEVNDLKPNDRVAWNRHYTVVDPKNIPLLDAEILGFCMNRYVVADDGVHFKVHYKHKNLEEHLVEAFGGVVTRDTPTVVDVHVSDKYFLEAMSKYRMLVGHNEKRLPPELFKSDNDVLTHFAKAAYTYAGKVQYRTSIRHGYGMRQLPPLIAEDFAHAIMRIGVVPSMTYEEDIFIEGPPRTRVGVFVDSSPFNEMLANLFGEKHNWRNRSNDSSRVRRNPIVTDDHFLVGIKSIEPVGWGEFWTKTVDDTGWYVGNGPISSNSGKDLLSTVGVAYVVYKLLCLKDPAQYYRKPPGDAIDIINIATNAPQAKNVFFKGLKNKISKAEWFRGKYTDTQEAISFIKGVTAYSGHSERESHEGLNLIMAVLDEISAFGEGSELNEHGKSAQNIYDAFRASVDSRFPGGVGCVALLSFPRHREDFITRKYNQSIAAKDVVNRTHTFTINEKLPPSEDNSFTIEWEEDHITQYILPDVWAIRRPSWEVNPQRQIDEYKNAFFTNKVDALQRFACMPTDQSTDSFFRQVDKIERAMVIHNPVDRNRRIDEAWKPDQTKQYFVHADLAQKQDKCAVAVAHVEKWTTFEGVHGYKETLPIVVVDMLAWWEPRIEGPVDLSEVKRWIINLRTERQIPISFISFDRWGCLSEESHVYTTNGPIPIKNVAVGDEVITRSGTSKITAKRDTGVQQVRRIKTKQGYAVDVTDDHRMLTGRGWISAKEIVVGDTLLAKRPDEISKEFVNPSRAYVAGALVADGWLNDPKDQSIGFTNADDECVDAVLKGLSEEFGYSGKPVVTSRGAASDYRIWSTSTVKKLREFGLGRQLAKTKYVPDSVMRGGREAYAEFLSGYIDGDGGVQHYVDKTGKNRYRVSMDTISYRLFEQVKWMLQCLGVNPVFMRNNNRGGRYSEYYRITIEGEQAEKLLSLVHPRIPRKQLAGFDGSRKSRWQFDNNGEKWLPVTSIKSIGPVQTFDISVEAEEFVVNGLVTHNSFDLIKELQDRGFRADTLSVAKKHYEDFAMMLYEERVLLPLDETLKDEMLALKVIKNKVDHPRKSSKDLSDATTGAIYNAISRTPRNSNQVVEVHTWAPSKNEPAVDKERFDPKQRDEAKAWLSQMGVL